MKNGHKLATACRVRMHGARTRLMHAHAGRGSALVAFVIAALVFNLGFPCLAMADWTTSSTVERGTNAVTGEPYITVTGKPCNSNFYAAARACGYSDSRIAQFTEVERAKLSNAETGGSFYLLASAFSDGLEWAGVWGQGFKSFLDGLEGVFGVALYTHTWTAANVGSELLNAAKRDANTILEGGNVGGGGSVQQEYVFTGGTPYSTATTNAFIDGGVLSYYRCSRARFEDPSYAKLGQSVELHIPYSAAPDFFDVYATGEYDLWAFITGNASGSMVNCSLRATRFGQASIDSAVNNIYATNSYINAVNVADGWWRQISLSVSNRYVCSGGVFTIDSSISTSGTGADSGASSMGRSGGILLSGGVHQGPVLPPNNWPTGGDDPVTEPPDVPEPPTDNPTEPTPPELPNPGNDVPVDPYEPDPTPTPPTTPTYDPDPTGTDYTVYLLRIIELLRTINDTLFDGFADLLAALRTHCDHIREALHDESIYLGSKFATVVHNEFVSFERWLQSTWTGYLVDQIDYVMGQQFQELEDYLHELFEWLAGQFDFTYGGSTFDDSSIVTWLRKIYGRLGGSAPNPGTGDDPDEGFDFWAWLINLIASRLGGILTDLVGDIGGFLSAVASKFPFTIPGDIVLYLTALDAQRTTPVVDITIPAINGWWSSFTYRIDLSPFDSAMAVVRSMILVYWGFVLVMKTDWLFGVFDFATDFVTGFVRRVTSS